METTVYRFDVPAANRHFAGIGSICRVDERERRIITGKSHDDYVHTLSIKGGSHGSVPSRLLIATDEILDPVFIAQYEQEQADQGRAAQLAQRNDDATQRLWDEAARQGIAFYELVDALLANPATDSGVKFALGDKVRSPEYGASWTGTVVEVRYMVLVRYGKHIDVEFTADQLELADTAPANEPGAGTAGRERGQGYETA